MATFKRGDVELHYEVHGEGFPILLFAPGGMRSAVPFWRRSEWDPIEALSPHFQVVAMDQRNAGRSKAPVSAEDGWHVYTADHIALLDHLGIEKTHLMGGCIGGPYCFGVIAQAPERVCAAVLQQSHRQRRQQPRALLRHVRPVDGRREAAPAGRPDAAWQRFRANMFDQPFLYNTSREFVAACTTPLLVLMGDDAYHPQATSREIAELAPNARLVEEWKDAAAHGTVETVVDFLKAHTPQ